MTEKIRVLYVDDERDLLEIGKLYLEQSVDFTVTTAISAPEALRLLEQEQFDAIISDYQMPEMDGIQFLVEVRKRFGSIPFILFTGRGREEVVIQAINNGVDFYLQKGGEPGAQFAELSHKVKAAASSKRADDALQKSEQDLKEAQAIARLSRWELNIVHNTLHWSDGIYPLFEINPAEFGATYEAFLNCIHPDDRDGVNAAYADSLKTKKPFEFSHRLLMKDGRIKWVNEICRTEYDSKGQPLRSVGIVQEITEIKRTEDALRENEERYRAIYDQSPIAIELYDANGTLVHVNPAGLNLFGIKNAQEIQNFSLFADPNINDEQKERLHRGETVQYSGPFDFEKVKTLNLYTTSREGIIWLDVLITPLGNRADSITGFLVQIQDITERKQIEKAHRESEEKFRLITETIDEAFWMADVEIGKIFYVSPSFERIWGLSRESLYNNPRSFLDAVHKEDRERVLADLEIEKTGQPFDHEYRIVLPDGNIRNIWDRGFPIRDEKGQITIYVGIAIDITERKRAEETLKESEEFNRNLVENLPDYIIVYRPDGKILYVNPATVKGFGYNVNELVGTSVISHVAPECRKKVTANITARREGSDTPEYETILITKDGQRKTVIAKGTLVHYHDGSATLLLLIDITERKNAEEALLRKTDDLNAAYENLTATEEELRANLDELTRRELALWDLNAYNRSLLEASIDPLVTISPYGRILDVNTSTEKVTGYSREELIGTDFSDYFTEPEKAKDGYHRVFTNGTVRDYPLEIQHKDGHITPVLYNATVYRDESGKVSGVFAAARDITERKKAEEALQHQSASLSILNAIITMANNADDLSQLLENILTESLRLLDFDAGGIYLVDRSTRTANVVHSKNLPKEFLAEIQPLFIDKKPYDTLFIQNEPIFTENYAQIAPNRSKKYGFQSMASIPLLSKGVAVGALNFASTRRHVISDEEKQTLFSISRELGSTIERMDAEDKAKNASKNLVTLFNSIDEMVFVLDMQGHILVVNNTVLKRLSYTPEELTGMDVLLLHVPERRDEALRNVQGMIAGTIDSCPVPVLAKDGTRIEVETKVTRGFWNGNEVLIGVSRDITERKRAESAITESFAIFKTVMDSLDALVYVSDMKTHEILFINQYGKEIFGDITGKICWKSIQVDKNGPCTFCTNEKLLDLDGNPTGILIWEFKNTINEHWYECHDSAIRWTDNRIVRIEIASDITERKELEKEMEYHEQELQKFSTSLATANRKLTLLSSITRHDINNQLSLQMGYLALLEQKQLDPTTFNNYFGKIRAAAQRISAMIRFTKEYENIGITVPTWQDCRTLLATATKEAPLGKVMVKNDLPPGTEVFADSLIVKVFYNLMDNAVRYGGKITIIRFSAEERDADHLIVCEDDGVGVLAEEKEKIFERGFGKNTGLGLALAREILSITGITIRETGEPGKGARFEITVPKGAWRMTGTGA